MPIFHRPELTNLRGKHCCYQWIVADRILYNRITSECLLLGNDSRMDSVKNKKKRVVDIRRNEAELVDSTICEQREGSITLLDKFLVQRV